MSDHCSYIQCFSWDGIFLLTTIWFQTDCSDETHVNLWLFFYLHQRRKDVEKRPFLQLKRRKAEDLNALWMTNLGTIRQLQCLEVASIIYYRQHISINRGWLFLKRNKDFFIIEQQWTGFISVMGGCPTPIKFEITLALVCWMVPVLCQGQSSCSSSPSESTRRKRKDHTTWNEQEA